MMKMLWRWAVVLPCFLACAGAGAQTATPSAATEAVVKKALAERLERLPNRIRIDEVRRSAIDGLWEVRFNGSRILYSDDKGEFVVMRGSMIDLKSGLNLTEQRIQQLITLPFDKLPLKDALVYKQGNGSRRIAVFSDPLCPYCRQYERDLAALKDSTVYVFLIAQVSPDSVALARDVVCSRDPAAAWRALMLEGRRAPKAAAGCDSKLLDRNMELAEQQRVDGTPETFFESGQRKSGALPAAELDKALASGGATPAAPAMPLAPAAPAAPVVPTPRKAG